MFKNIWAVAVVAFLAWPSGTAFAQQFEYLGSAINHMMEAQLKGPRITVEEFADATQVACAALSKAVEDRMLITLIEKHNLNPRAAEQLRDDLEKLAGYLVVEADALKGIGVEPSNAERIALMSTAYIDRPVNANLNPGLIHKWMDNLRMVACQISQVASRESRASQRWAIVSQVTQGVVGLGVVVGDVALAGPTSGLAVASVPVGALILSDALQRIQR